MPINWSKIKPAERFKLLTVNSGIEWKQEHYFHPKRRWRFDFAHLKTQVAVEIEGGTWGKGVVCNWCKQKVYYRTKAGKLILVREAGRHNNPKGMAKDAEKYNAAQVLGWTVFRLTTDMVSSANIKIITEFVEGRG